MLPDDNELARIRADLEAATLPSTCDILSLTRTMTGTGSWTETWGTATASVKCRLDPLKVGEYFRGEATRPFGIFVLTLPHGTDITEAHRVRISEVDYAVTGVDNGKSWSSCVRATVEEV